MPRKSTKMSVDEVREKLAEISKTTKERTKKTSKDVTTTTLEEPKPKRASKKGAKDPTTVKIEAWLEKMHIKNYEIHDGVIDVFGFCNLRGYLEGNLPDYIQFGTIHAHPIFQTTDFDISDNPIKSLRGCPHTVEGNFKCFNTKVNSLEHIPSKVAHTVVFYHNSIEPDADDIMKATGCEYVKDYPGYKWDPKEWGIEEKKTKKKTVKKSKE